MNTKLFTGRTASLVSFLIASLAAGPAFAELINLNFTRTDLPYASAIETSPATPGGPAGTWNSLTNGTANALFSYESDAADVLLSDGSPGPTLTFDTSSGTSSFTNWNGTSLNFTTTNYTTIGGVYDVTNLYESGLVNGGNSTTGFRVKGLTPGTYDVFLVPIFRNAQGAGVKADAAVTLSIGLGNDTDARNTGGYALTSTAASPTQNIVTTNTDWVAATDGSTAYNYVGATVIIDSTNRWLAFLMGDSATTGPDRPGPSVIQLRRVTAVTPSGVPRITSILVSSPNVIISGTNGTHNGTYRALTSGNLQLPLGSWTSVLTNSFDAGGNFTFTNSPAGSPAFYIIQQQP